MEEIIIKKIDVKESGLVIVGYNGNREATLNTKWQSQEVDYLQKDVGIGGRVKVLVVQKGNYTNITKVDFDSAVKGSIEVMQVECQSGTRSETAQPKPSRDKSIIAQCMTKCATYGRNDVTIGMALDMYHEACLSLEQNG